jgi:hypothetical protein
MKKVIFMLAAATGSLYAFQAAAQVSVSVKIAPPLYNPVPAKLIVVAPPPPPKVIVVKPAPVVVVPVRKRVVVQPPVYVVVRPARNIIIYP